MLAARIATRPAGLVRKVFAFQLDNDAKEQAMRETTFADGLRGIAAVFVVISHVVLCYATSIIPPCCAPGSESPRLFQRPIFRLVTSGHSWVAMFFILMGFVNALRPVKLARDGHVDKALAKLAASAFSRIWRLVLPATAATVISWLLCQFGLYGVSAESDAFWLHENTPLRSTSISQAFVDLFQGIVDTWAFGSQNQYDQPQWALCYLLEGSIMVICALLMTANMTPVWRTVVLVALSIFSLNWSMMMGDPWVGFCCFLGITLCEFSLSNLPAKLAPFSPYLSPPLIIASTVLMSYPSGFYHSAGWSSALQSFAAKYLVPGNPEAIDRMYGSIGGLMLTFAIIISPHARWALSRPLLLTLGKLSFAMYLLHGMVVRTIFAWVLHIGQVQIEVALSQGNGAYRWTEQRYPVPGTIRCALATITLAFWVGFLSSLWNSRVEPLFAKAAGRLESIVTGRSDTVSSGGGGEVRSRDAAASRSSRSSSSSSSGSSGRGPLLPIVEVEPEGKLG